MVNRFRSKPLKIRFMSIIKALFKHIHIYLNPDLRRKVKEIENNLHEVIQQIKLSQERREYEEAATLMDKEKQLIEELKNITGIEYLDYKWQASHWWQRRYYKINQKKF